MTRRGRLARRLGGGDGGQLESEHGAVRHALGGEPPAVLLDDAVRYREPEPRALPHLLRREEGLEDARHDLGRDAGAVVLELDHHRRSTVLFSFAGAHADGIALAAGQDGVLGIEQKVQEHLLQLVHVTLGGRHAGGVVELDVDAREAQPRRAQRQGLLEDGR